MGYKSPPKAIMVTPDAPVKAVKIAADRSETMAIPPGKKPNKDCAIFKSL